MIIYYRYRATVCDGAAAKSWKSLGALNNNFYLKKVSFDRSVVNVSVKS